MSHQVAPGPATIHYDEWAKAAERAGGPSDALPRTAEQVQRILFNAEGPITALLARQRRGGADAAATATVGRAVMESVLGRVGLTTAAENQRFLDGLASEAAGGGGDGGGGGGGVPLRAFWGACERGSRLYVRQQLLGPMLRKLARFLLLQLPLALGATAALLGAVLAAAEGWNFSDGFWLVVMELSGCDVDLTDPGADNAPSSDGGKLAAAFVGVVSIAVFGAVLGVMGGEMLGPMVTLARMDLHPVGGAAGAARKLAALAFVALPLLALLLASSLAPVLVAAEGWSYRDSFYVCLAEVTMTDVTLVNAGALPIGGTGGKVVLALVSTWALAIFGGGALGLMGGALAGPLLAGCSLGGEGYVEPPPLSVLPAERLAALKRSLLAAAFAQHGVGLQELLAEHAGCGAVAAAGATAWWRVGDFRLFLDLQLPGAINGEQLGLLLDAVGSPHDGSIDLAVLFSFLSTGVKVREAEASKGGLCM